MLDSVGAFYIRKVSVTYLYLNASTADTKVLILSFLIFRMALHEISLLFLEILLLNVLRYVFFFGFE